VEKAYNSPHVDYVARHNWLEWLLDAHLENLRISRLQDSIALDPLAAFTAMLTHGAVLYVWHIADLLLANAEDQSLILPLAARGLESARELCRFAQDIELRGLFGAHTLTPIPLFFGAYRLRSYLEIEGSKLGHDEKEQIEELIQICLELLQKLEDVNNLASHGIHQYHSRRFQPL
jgi:hypothetical protein